ncbi:DUF397 domain-containing protein [Streptomyces sp. NBC_00038]|uniref:DUF397 domain-containing protein n=1 Tax=Streptomyces sp. NBC_00038 TaxID=2903615 RepID=UPI00225005A0|nr:DUF397 domain-containing protein [Streptomyces sp. NBC_00038]MCX5557298.1 DUF397 domain-containing protein [Streptomyces sp. NBC_00038]
MGSNAVPTGIQWRKSSYSGDQGGQCAPLGPLAWRKSTYSSDQGGECVEIASTPCATIAVRDSKVPDGPALALTPAAFTAFVAQFGA